MYAGPGDVQDGRMTALGSARYATSLAGQLIEVDASRSGLTSTARLYVDGAQVDEQSSGVEEIRLAYEDVDVRVRCVWPGRISHCALVLRDAPTDAVEAGDEEGTEHRVPLDPPPGTRAAKMAEFERSHPRLYASRHIAVAVGEVLLVVLGVGVLLRSLLPRIDFSWLPDVDMSWVPDIDLSWIPDPLGWFWGLLPDISMPGWWDTVMGSTRYWVPILIALGVAGREVDKRRKARDAKAEREE